MLSPIFYYFCSFSYRLPQTFVVNRANEVVQVLSPVWMSIAMLHAVRVFRKIFVQIQTLLRKQYWRPVFHVLQIILLKIGLGAVNV